MAFQRDYKLDELSNQCFSNLLSPDEVKMEVSELSMDSAHFRYESDCKSPSTLRDVTGKPIEVKITGPKIPQGVRTLVISCIDQDDYNHPNHLSSNLSHKFNHGAVRIELEGDFIILDDLKIVSTKMKDFKKSIENRIKVGIDPFGKGFCKGRKFDNKSVRICFQVYFETNIGTLKSEPYVSSQIITSIAKIGIIDCIRGSSVKTSNKEGIYIVATKGSPVRMNLEYSIDGLVFSPKPEDIHIRKVTLISIDDQEFLKKIQSGKGVLKLKPFGTNFRPAVLDLTQAQEDSALVSNFASQLSTTQDNSVFKSKLKIRAKRRGKECWNRKTTTSFTEKKVAKNVVLETRDHGSEESGERKNLQGVMKNVEKVFDAKEAFQDSQLVSSILDHIPVGDLLFHNEIQPQAEPYCEPNPDSRTVFDYSALESSIINSGDLTTELNWSDFEF